MERQYDIHITLRAEQAMREIASYIAVDLQVPETAMQMLRTFQVEIAKLMEQHTEDLLSIDSIATMTNVSRRQLERLFESDMGASPSAIYMKIRMAAALNMVVRTNKPLIEIALETGFESLSHFTRRFRAAFGDTPSQIRRDGRRQAG